MSRGYYKTCGRKVAAPPPTQNIQFDTLFCENSNKPSAAKSAGTLGKWGITSFTSIRSSSFTVGGSTRTKPEPVTYKRSRYESKSNNDAYSFNPPSPTAAVSPVQPKPKKFFKSRNADGDKQSTPSGTTPPASKKPVKSSKAAFKRSSPVPSFEESESDSYASATKEAKEAKESESSNSHNPKIVLRIFKGTAQILTDVDVPKKDKEKEKDKDKDKDKETRRRATHDSDDEYVPPKKHRHRTKETEKTVEPEAVVDQDLESLRNDLEGNTDEEIKTEPEEEPISRRTRSEDKEKSVIEENPIIQEEPILEEPKVEEAVAEVAQECEENIENIEHAIEETLAEPIAQDSTFEEEERLVDSGFPSDDKVDEILDLSSNMKQDSIEYVEEEQDDDVPLDLHIPHVSEKTDPVEPPISQMNQLDPAANMPEEQLPVKNEVESSDSDYSEPLERPSVVRSIKSEPVVPKLTIRPKKGSIFKSRVGEKRNAHYIHKWCDKEEVNKQQNIGNSSLGQGKIIEGEFSENLTRITNYTKPDEFSEESEMFTSVTCSKNSKDFYTVVRNVKKAHQIQESGEFQEFNDDVEYILDALQDNNPIGTRCLSAITLASKCMVPAFRMHVRAHGTVQKFFKALHDASKDQSLGMCTATVMFVLSQDRLNMDLDRESLELMLSLLESDASSQALDDCGFTHAQLSKTKDRVRSLCQEIKEQGHANHLNLDNITVGQLAMETLLSLTSKRAGEWFKEELRDLGGLEHIVRTIVETATCIDPTIAVWEAPLLERMRKLDRCLRVLENVTLNNEDNSNYLLAYGGGELVDTVLRVFMTCGSQILLYPVTSVKDKLSVGAVLRDCLVATLKILINITHDFNNKSSGSSLAGKKPGLIDTSLHVLFIVPDYVPEEQKFDLTFMSLMLLINLVEHSEANRQLMIEAQAPRHPEIVFENPCPAIAALISLFSQQEELARNVERKTDAILDGENKVPEQSKSHEEYIEETVALLLQKAGRHMEYTFVAAYIATLLGYIVMDSEDNELFVRSCLPNQNFVKLVEVLQKFFNFMNLTASSGSASTRGIKATEMLIKNLTNIDQKVKTEVPQSEEHKLFY